MAYELYIPNPGPPPAPSDPCTDTALRATKVCGDLGVSLGNVTIPSAGPTTAAATTVEWSQGTRTTSGTPGAISALSTSSKPAQRAILRTDDANTDDIRIGPTNAADFHLLSPGSSYLIENPPGTKFDIANWYIQSASASQVINYIYA